MKHLVLNYLVAWLKNFNLSQLLWSVIFEISKCAFYCGNWCKYLIRNTGRYIMEDVMGENRRLF